MSFLNTIRGLGRGPKKNKKDLDSTNVFYQHPNGSGSPVRRSQSPTKLSPNKQQRINQVYNKQASPTRRGRSHANGDGSTRLSPRKEAARLVAPVTTINAPQDLPLFLQEPFVKTSLVKGSFKTIVQLPKYVDYGEWIALNIFEMFNNLNQFYEVFAEYMTPEAYPSMNAGPTTNYLWVDSSGQSINLPAVQYINYVLTWISNKLNDQSVFPTKSGGAFPQNFMKDCKNITRQMFRIFAHIYYNHFEKIVHLSLEAHWNSFFSHFISFVKEFKLIDKNELEPLLPLIESFEEQGKII
ncbi:Maintenance of ploidy protein mob2 [Yamadazyma tenuis]|uniref:Mob1/phocein n=1 Tax=Candida tenuis (strain ATCC 10573 / BCRC 21748 / CBS 615 / JCM 9827 / NBRC 10315 / NRRL Y-1498 / VKM Y-70) TaxID=590646 RepID=G3B4C0_CANTC|nr:uncharacterized protein CANTEDRAFT_113971 [Yamadazyma tenuis ATCC 10573]EGV63946.1 hypothetical protein CANTEDRAFT_113971 [Yamadazyma tenuis ATCC 10573]WEJ96439.1 Maintenance of ploidy protein mob2 [Yamadazyma tenuis]